MGGILLYMGYDYANLIPKVIPIFALLGLGYFLKIKGFISGETTGEIKKLIVNISLPAVLFLAFLNVNFRVEFLLVILVVFLTNMLMLLVGKGVAVRSGVKDPHFPLLFTGFEVGMLGISLFGTIYGLQNIKYIGVIDIGQELYVWFVLLGLLLSLQKRQENRSLKELLKSFITSPIIIAILLGILLNSVGIKSALSNNFLFAAIINSIELVASITIPLILIVIGYEINFKGGSLSLPLRIIMIRLVILLPLALLAGKYIFTDLLNLSVMYSVALTSVMILPPPFIIPLFFSEEDEESGEKTYVYNTLSLSTVVSIAIFIIMTLIYGVSL